VSRQPCVFKQTDLTRALKGARAAGMEVARIEIEKDGRIVVVPGKTTGQPEADDSTMSQSNPWDTYAADKKRSA
jgi:hypothetical protein